MKKRTKTPKPSNTLKPNQARCSSCGEISTFPFIVNRQYPVTCRLCFIAKTSVKTPERFERVEGGYKRVRIR